MFPEISRDDVFRLETPRLWLRWPTAADAAVMQPWASLPEVAGWTSSWAAGADAAAIAEKLLAARARNADGRGMCLVLTPQGDNNSVIGIAGLAQHAPAGGGDGAASLQLGYHLNPAFRGQGLMAEAVTAIARAAFWLTAAPAIEAGVVIGNAASRRVLEKCGFVAVGSGVDTSPLYGARPIERFVLARPARQRLVRVA